MTMERAEKMLHALGSSLPDEIRESYKRLAVEDHTLAQVAPDARTRTDEYLDFIRVWHESETTQEVRESLGISASQMHAMVTALRKKGVPLKQMKRAQRIDWNALREFAEGLDGTE